MALPQTNRKPAFSVTNELLDRNCSADSAATNESPFGSTLATPVDEAQIDGLDILGQKLLVDASNVLDRLGMSSSEDGYVPRGRSVIIKDNKQPSSIIRAVSRAKKLAKALVPSKTSSTIITPASPDSPASVYSTDLSSHPEPPNTSSTLYTHPNESIEGLAPQPSISIDTLAPVDDDDNDADPDDTILAPTFSTLPRSDSLIGVYSDIPGKQSFEDPNDNSILSQLYSSIDGELNLNDDDFIFASITLSSIPRMVLQILCFLPWCVLVGGSILTCPQRLDSIIFGQDLIPRLSALGSVIGIDLRISYQSQTPSHQNQQSGLGGLRRLAYYTECAYAHLAIFVAFVGGFLYKLTMHLGPDAGCPVAVGLLTCVVGQTILAWSDFRSDFWGANTTTRLELGSGDERLMVWTALFKGASIFGDEDDEEDKLVTLERLVGGEYVLEFGKKGDKNRGDDKQEGTDADDEDEN